MSFNNEVSGPVIDDHDVKVSDVMDKDASEFLAEAIAEIQDKPIATAKRIAKQKSLTAGLYEAQANMNNDRHERQKWGKVRWSLKTLR